MRRLETGHRLAAVVVGAILVVGACDSAPTASPNATPTPFATIPPTGAPPSVTPEATVTPTTAPTLPVSAGPWQPAAVQDSVSNSQFQDVVWTGTGFVAVGFGLDGGGTFLRSSDGKTWKSGTSGPGSGPPSDIAAGPNGIVAIGTLDEKTASWFSTDGIHWQYHLKVFPKSLGASDLVTVTDVVATPTGWLAVGRDDEACFVACESNTQRAMVWTSTDGLSWTRVRSAALPGGGMNSVTATEGGFVAGGDSEGRAAFWTSPDGLTWARVPDPGFGAEGESISVVGVAAAGGTIVAVGMARSDTGSDVVAWSSTDGQTWTPSSVESPQEGQVFNVAAVPTGFLATGPSGEASCLGGIWWSPDGAAWTCEATDPAFATFGPYAAAGSPTVEIAVGLTEVGWDPDSGLGSPGAVWWRPVR